MRILDRVIRLLPSVVLTTASSLCISHLSAAAQAAQPTHAISGQVVNSVSGEPIARARVQVGSQPSVLTDHDGRFAFAGVQDDPAYAFAFKPGYFDENKAVIAKGESTILRLIPEAIVFGTITDQNGQPVQGLAVQLRTLGVRNGLRHWQDMRSTLTSVEGKYRFAELQAGQYSLATTFRVDGLAEAASSVAFAPVTFPPQAGDVVHGSLTLAPGDRVETNASVAMEKLYPVSGVIHGITGQGARVFATDGDGNILDPPTNLYPGGAFRLRLPSGSYRLWAHSFAEREQRQQELGGMREITVGEAPLAGISITLEPPVTLPIEVEYQAVATGAQNAPPGPPPYLNASLTEEDARGHGNTLPAQPRTLPGKAHAFEPGAPMVFLGLEPGSYVLQTQPQPPWYVASATCGNLDLTRDALVIAAGAATPCTVRLVYRNDSASLKYSVSAEDGDSHSPRLFVTAIPLDDFIQPPDFSVTDSSSPDTPVEGTLEGISPGRYLVLAAHHLQQLPYRDNEAMQRYLSLGQQVTLTRGGKSEVQLKIVTGEP
jgi:hypothetical protein